MTGSTTLTVLNVSTDAAGRGALTRAFEQAGFDVWEAASRDEALSLVPQGPDLILLDHCLPGMPEFEVCCRLKAQAATAMIPVFCVGSDPGAAPLSRSAAGANLVDRYLNPPLQPAEVVEAARDSLRARQTELLNHRFFEAAADAVVFIGDGGVIVHLNTQTEKLFGYRRDELLNQAIEILVPERLRARHVEHRRAYFGNPLPRPMGSGFTAVGLRKDGTEFPIDIALSPLPAESGLFVACTVRDMTIQRRLEEELRQRTRDLEDADRHKDQFLTTLAHELRSPLAAIAYSAELLRRSDIGPEVHIQAAGIVLEETNFMRCLLEDLSELPRVKRGDLVVRAAPTDLAEVARLAVEISRPLIERRGHALEIVMPPSPVRAQGDAARLAQIVTNLLANAARYTPEGGCIRLSIGQEERAAVLKVRDNGIGIPKQMLTRVFELFTRLEGARQKYAGGMGIGLAFVRRLVEIQGGSVEAFSEGDGQGSEFVVRLPLARDTRLTATTVAAVEQGHHRTLPEPGPPAAPVS